MSGHTEEVEAATNGLRLYHEEKIGRSRGVTVLLEPGERICDGYDVSIRRMSLQKIFLALCGEEA